MSDTLSVLKQLFAAYPNTQVEKQTVAVYLRVLGTMPPADLQVVVDQCIAECKFLPTVAEILERHRNLSGAMLVPTWEEAWELMQRAMREVPYGEKPRFVSNPYLQRTVDIIGWRELRTNPEIAILRAQFRDVYRGLVERDGKLDALLPQARDMVESKAGQLAFVRRLLEAK